MENPQNQNGSPEAKIKKQLGNGRSAEINSFQQLEDEMLNPFEQIASVLSYIERHLKMISLCMVRQCKNTRDQEGNPLMKDSEVASIYDSEDADKDVVA